MVFPSNEISIFAFFSSPPAAAITIRPLDVTMTNRCRLLVVLPPPKKRENFLGASAEASFEFGL